MKHPSDFSMSRRSTCLTIKTVVCRHFSVVLTCVDYIGYIAKFPGVDDNDTSMTLALNRLNIASPRSVKRRLNHFYSPYSASKRRCNSDSPAISPVSPSEVCTLPIKCEALSSGSVAKDNARAKDDSKGSERINSWGMLVSKTQGCSDISLIHRSTGLGKVCDFVDMATGERQTEFSKLLLWNSLIFQGCRIYRLKNGAVGITALNPVLIGGKCIMGGEKLLLENNQQIALCEEDMSILTEYEIRFGS